MIPSDLDAAIAEALQASATSQQTPAEWRTAFAASLVRALRACGLILVPRGRSGSRMTVDADLYSLALSMKGAAERQLGAVARLVGPAPDLDPSAADLVTEFANLIAALTGHAPLQGVGRCAHVGERLRQIHEAALGTPAPTLELEKETA